MVGFVVELDDLGSAPRCVDDLALGEWSVLDLGGAFDARLGPSFVSGDAGLVAFGEEVFDGGAVLFQPDLQCLPCRRGSVSVMRSLMLTALAGETQWPDPSSERLTFSVSMTPPSANSVNVSLSPGARVTGRWDGSSRSVASARMSGGELPSGADPLRLPVLRRRHASYVCGHRQKVLRLPAGALRADFVTLPPESHKATRNLPSGRVGKSPEWRGI